MPDRIHPDLVDIALDRVSGAQFEKFANAFTSALAGISFVPLGGMHDGGADGIIDFGLFEAKGSRRFLQASIQTDIRKKIRHTIQRLRTFGRDPQSLIYCSSKSIQHIDKEENLLTDELDVFIRIRDRNYIATHINDSSATVSAFNHHLSTTVSFLKHAGNIPLIPQSPFVTDPSVYVFLRQEVDRRLGNRSLVETPVDALILWALEGTDPDQDIFMTRDDIAARIELAVPAAKQFVRGSLHHRLEVLSSKSNLAGRSVRWHRKQDRFCLPYETRMLVETENLDDEHLRLTVLDRLKVRALGTKELRGDEEGAAKVAAAALRAVQLTFEKEGLEFSAFLSGAREAEEYQTIADQIDDALVEAGVKGGDALRYREATLRVLAGSFYLSTEEERIYFSKLSRTYLLLFSLQAEPRIVEYFQTMTGDFSLYIGSDIIVRSLSERYLALADQSTRNMLRMASEVGAKLILAEPVLEEVHSHLEATDWEFRNYFMENEPYITLPIASQAPKILIRAYFYARLRPSDGVKKVGGWRSFIEQFCDYNKLHSAAGREQLRDYLCSQMGMEYQTADSLKKLADEKAIEILSRKLQEVKGDARLALNDATLALAIYGRRIEMGESSRGIEFGFRTWWLTGERKILKYTGDLVRDNFGARYIMRPEFLLNFFAMAPDAAAVRESYRAIFPSILGIRLAARVDEKVFRGIMEQAKEWGGLEPGRIKVKMGELANQLKGDLLRRYNTESKIT